MSALASSSSPAVTSSAATSSAMPPGTGRPALPYLLQTYASHSTTRIHRPVHVYSDQRPGAYPLVAHEGRLPKATGTPVWVHFESVRLPGTDNHTPRSDMVYMIGVLERRVLFHPGTGAQGAEEYVREEVLQYHNFTAEAFTREEEARIARSFIACLDAVSERCGRYLSLCHWSTYEERQWQRILSLYPELEVAWHSVCAKWYDVMGALRAMDITVFGYTGYQLKEWMRILHEHGAIRTTHAGHAIPTGADALEVAERVEEELRLYRDQTPLVLVDAIQQVLVYNRTDCLVTLELYEYLQRLAGAGTA